MICRFSVVALPLAFGVALAFAGCNNAPATVSIPKNALPEEHGHAEEGPHHGHLIELGEEEYHAELTHDEATKKVSIYLLDKTAKVAVPIADREIVLNLAAGSQPFQVKLLAAPQQGDPAGQASCFSITDEKVLETLESPKTTGRLNVTINGKAYTGEVAHQEHGDHKKH